MNKLLLFMFILFLMSCSTSRNMKQDVEEVRSTKDLINSAKNLFLVIPNSSRIVQIVTYKKDAMIKKMQVVFVKNKVLSITALSLLGVEIATFLVTEEGIKKVGGILNIQTEHFYKVMADMLAVYAPKNVLYRYGRGQFTILDGSDSREIYREGNKIVRIKYSNNINKWHGHIELMNFQYGYRLDIRTIEFKNEGIRK